MRSSAGPEEGAEVSNLFGDYLDRIQSHDEVVDRDGALRPHWEYVVRSLEALGPQALRRRADEARRLLREAGVTYNASDGVTRAWQLDPIPFTVSSEEWAGIEAALIQRAELLNSILADVYGPRSLLEQGRIPADLVLDHSGFLRPCAGSLPKGRPLVLYTADIVRGADGALRVLSDRAQAPSGAGYALENRLVLRQVLPSMFRDAHVHRLAQFFRTLRTTLASLSPRPVDDPTIVILTSGPKTETYFEHASLANYLGYPLVQGQDLSVRDGCVWLESLGGERQVDVILRRMDDDWCDPLELRPDSQLGVVGLVEAVRRGNVSIANPLGSGVLENPGLTPFLPDLSRHLLGQPLLMESVPTWWCGDEESREHVLANLESMVLKPISRPAGPISTFGAALSASDREGWAARIRACPHRWAAQEDFVASSVPAIANGSLEPRAAVLRTFLVAHGDGYVVMPGGLTRIAPDRTRHTISSQAGAVSKDTWVLASEPEKASTLISGPTVAGSFRTPVLSARAAENFFWMARYAERAENTARLLRTVVDKRDEVLEAEDAVQREGLARLLRSSTHVTTTYPGFLGPAGEPNVQHPEPELLSTIRDAERPGSLTFALRAMLAAADGVRDLVSADTLRVVHDVSSRLERLRKQWQPDLAGVGEELDRLVISLVALSGLAVESMTRGTGWRFLDGGRRIERAQFVCALLRSLLVEASAPEVEEQGLEAALSACESRITYRWRYRATPQVRPALELLLLDPTNPRSLRFQLDRITAHLTELPGREPSRLLTPAGRLVLEASTTLQLSDPAALASTGGGGRREALDQLLSRITHLLSRTSDALSEAFFAQGARPFAVGPLAPRPGRAS